MYQPKKRVTSVKISTDRSGRSTIEPVEYSQPVQYYGGRSYNRDPMNGLEVLRAVAEEKAAREAEEQMAAQAAQDYRPMYMRQTPAQPVMPTQEALASLGTRLQLPWQRTQAPTAVPAPEPVQRTAQAPLTPTVPVGQLPSIEEMANPIKTAGRQNIGVGRGQSIGNSTGEAEILPGEPLNLTREGQWAAKHPVLGTAMYGAANVVGGAEGFVNMAEAAAKAAMTGEKIDQNHIKSAPVAQGFRTGAAEGFRRAAENGPFGGAARAAGIDSSDGRYTEGERALDFLSGVGADAVSSTMGMMTGGNLSTVLMGANAANQSLYETANDPNTTAGQAVALASANGIAEALFEYVSLDKLIQAKTPATAKQFVKQLLVQSGVEASEEIATEVANTLSDIAIRGDNSESGREYQSYLAAGMEPDAAAAKTISSVLGKVFMAGLGGALSGGLHTGVFTGVNTLAGGNVLRGNVRNGLDLYEVAQGIDASTPEGQRAMDMAMDMAAREDFGEKAPGILDYGRLNNAFAAASEAGAFDAAERENERQERNLVRRMTGPETAVDKMERIQGSLRNSVPQQAQVSGVENVVLTDQERGEAAQSLLADSAVKSITWDTAAGTVRLSLEGNGDYVFQNERGETAQLDAEQAADLIPAGQTISVDTGIQAQQRTEAPARMTQELRQTAQNDQIERRNDQIAPSTEAQLAQLAADVAQGEVASAEAQRQEVYQAGYQQNPDFQSVMDRATMLSEQEKTALFQQGGQDAVNAVRMEALNGRQEGNGLSDEGRIRTVSLGAGEQGGRVSAETEAVRRVWRRTGTPADNDAGNLRISVRESAEKVIPGSKAGTFVYIPQNKTQKMQSVETAAKANGLKTVFWAGGEAVSAKGESFRGATIPGTDTIYLQADNHEFAVDQTYKHELAENTLTENDFKKIYRTARQASKAVDMAVKVYQKYSGSDVYGAMKELVCDSNGLMNQFAKLAEENPDDLRYQKVKEILEDAIRAINPHVSSAVEGKLSERRESARADAAAREKVSPLPGVSAKEKAASVNNSVQYSVELPYRFGTEAARAWVNTLDSEARETADMFSELHDIGMHNKARVMVGVGEGRHMKLIDVTTRNMLASEWNEYVKTSPTFAETARKLAEALPANVRKEAHVNMDGSITATPFEKSFKMMRSFMQRIVDALPGGTIGNKTMVNGKEVKISNEKSIPSVGGEEYRKALLEERRRQYRQGILAKKSISGLSKDTWGTMGFLASNTKTTASGDFTTFCPQMHYGNGGCWYCYRLAALTSGVNNKLVGENVWYTGEILRLKQDDINSMNRNGGLRIQSFGDWMEQYTPQLLDLLVDAETVGLQIKIITKEPSMVDAVALLREQGYGKNLYFNLSADYSIEEATGTINPARPFMERDGKTYWKRALTVEEANEYRKKYPWVNTRIVATNTDEFIRGLESPYVDVVTGYHGKIRQQERISSENGEILTDVEPLGDAGMPRFRFDISQKKWVREFNGKTKLQQRLADAIEERGLQYAYYVKTCCQTGRCATCEGKCGALARDFNVKNATNRDTESVKYWQKNMKANTGTLFGEKYSYQFPHLLKNSDMDRLSREQEQRQAIYQAGFDMDEDYEDVIAQADLIPAAEAYKILQDGMKAGQEQVEHSTSLTIPEGEDASSPSIASDIGVQHSTKITDKALIERLDKEIDAGDYIVTYKAMQKIGNDYYPPMAGKVKGADGKYRLNNPYTLKAWHQADEDPANVSFKKGNDEYGYYKLNKGDKSNLVPAAYNPYEHSSNTVLNDQFTTANRRGNLVVVKCLVPKSEIYGKNRYKAQYAKDSTGIIDWKSGETSTALKKLKPDDARMVYLSRYIKPVEVMSDKFVAEEWKKALEGTDLSVPFNVVTPGLLKELENLGVPINYEGTVQYQKSVGRGIKYSRSLTGGMAIEDVEAKLNELIEKYGALPKGENAKNNFPVPEQTSDNKRVRRYVRTAGESGLLSDAMNDALKEKIVKEALSYEPMSDQASAEYAASVIRIGGMERAQKEWDRARRSDSFTKDDMALGQFLLKEYAKKNDVENVVKMVTDLAAEGTRMGQNIQAMRMLKKYAEQVPAIGLGYIQRTVDQMNREAKKKMGKKYREMVIDKKLEAEYVKAQTRDEIDAALGKIYKDLGEQVQKTIPEEIIDRLRAWRYMSMLGNPRTHIRNLVGNAIFVPAVQLKNAIGTGLEKAMNADVRTKSLAISKEAAAFAKQDALEMEDVLRGEADKSIRQLILDQRKTFATKAEAPLEKFSRGNSELLEKEDWIFLRGHYERSLGQFLTANNIDTENINPTLLGAARKYAVQEAQKATYRDASRVAQWLNQSKGAGTVVKYMMEGMLPFKKTPTNILKRGVEYSPAGLVASLVKGTYDLNKKKITVNEYIDGISSGLAGSAIFAVGMFLASTGAVMGGFDDDDDKRKKKLRGLQEYAVKIGNHTYTIDWAAPGSLPLFVGVETMYALKKEHGATLGDLTSAAGRLIEPMINMSMLSGLNDTLDAISYSDDKLSAFAAETFYNLLGQYVPTVVGQVARTMDTTQRINYQDMNKGMSKNMLYFLEKMQNKIPYLTFSNDPYLNEFGQENVTESRFIAALQNFISPGYISKVKDDKVLDELEKLQENTEEDVFPKKMPKYLGTKKDRVDLTSAEYTKFQRTAGQTAYNILDRMVDDKRYDKLTADEQAEAIKMAYEYAKAIGRRSVQKDYELKGDAKKIYAEVTENDRQAYDVILSKVRADSITAGVEGDIDEETGEEIKGSKKLNTIDKILESDLSDDDMGEVYEDAFPSKRLDAWEEDGGDPYDFMMGTKLAQEVSDLSDEQKKKRFSYVVNSNDYTSEQKVAWFVSSDSYGSKNYEAWSEAGGTDWDYIKSRSDLERFDGMETKKKRESVIAYIKKQTNNEAKRKALWQMAGYQLDSTKNKQKIPNGNYNKYFK